MAQNTIYTQLNHCREPHCCGCIDVTLDSDGEQVVFICNECGTETGRVAISSEKDAEYGERSLEESGLD